MNDTCGCCEGTQQLTPKLIANRPGLEALAYRLGTHAAFLETMKARLSSFYLDIQQDELDKPKATRLYPLRGLTTRVASDPSISLLDGWATVADVLAFYQERIANEGYLRTASERRSILELARLVGYALRPGVAATVYLAYTLDDNIKEPVIILPGARAQSVPGPGELPQSFETVEKLEARAAWNLLQPRMTKPQTKDTLSNAPIKSQTPRVYLKGINTNLKPNDPLLIDWGLGGDPIFVRVKDVLPDAAADRTLVTLQNWLGTTAQKYVSAKASPESVTTDAKRQLNDIAVRFLGEEADKRNLSRDTKMFGRVSGYLASLQQQLAEDVPFPAMLAHLNSETLLSLAKERQEAEKRGYTDLGPWIKSLMAELSGVAERASTLRAEALAREFTLAAQPDAGGTTDGDGGGVPGDEFAAVLPGLVKSPSVPPRNALVLDRKISTAFQLKADTQLQVLGAFRADVRELLPTVVRNTKVARDVAIKVYALRVKASPFGHNAPPTVARFIAEPASGEAPLLVHFTSLCTGDITSYKWNFGDDTPQSIAKDPSHTYQGGDYTVTLMVSGPTGDAQTQGLIQVQSAPVITIVAQPETAAPSPTTVQPQAAVSSLVEPAPQPNIIFLDADYNISPQSWIAVVRPTEPPRVIWLGVGSVTYQSLAAYGLSGKTTRLDLDGSSWFDGELTMDVVRSTIVYAQSEELPLAAEPIDDPICGSDDASDPNAFIELDGVYSDLQAGRWLIVSGERTDIQTTDKVPVTGIQSSELVMLSEVVQRVAEADTAVPASGEKTHTYIRLAKKLEYCYKRDTVKIYGNVVKATHGETRQEVLGSGDGSKAFQSFGLKQPPLTYVAAPTPAGAESTLHVRVNDIEWHEMDSLAGLERTDRNFITRTDDESKTTVVFGNGQQGARPPTGVENIKAVYRSGIGKPGNVKAEQISLLVTRPLGVKEVINPMRASGGADKESRDQARKNAPLGVLALDRLVSTQDYADFARTFAGIGKASAARLTAGRRQLVHVTIAGADDIPIDQTSDLYHNLMKALRDYGDPYLPIMVEVRELMLIVLSANVRVQPDYQWESVAPKVRAKLLDTFSFERRELGQDVLLSEVISAIQSVEGVAYVDVDMLGGVSEKGKTGKLRTPDEISEVVKEMIEKQESGPWPRVPVNMAQEQDGTIRPAQLAFLTPDVEATLILNEVKA
jgi:hypothetical protein